MVLLAVIPGILLFLVVWKFDTVEKESPALLCKLFVFGALSILAAILLRTLGVHAFTPLFKGDRSIWFLFVDSFVLTALIEECAKILVLKFTTWKNKEFNYTFDAIVYAVCVSVGFMTAENIVYLIKYRGEVEAVRLLLPIFAQIIISIFMGYFYGLAKLADASGDKKGAKIHLFEAFLIPFVMHGMFEFTWGASKLVLFIIFAVYVAAITIVAICGFVRLSRSDKMIPESRAEKSSASEEW
ncbi:MAG: PrsW family intramembrane metalloprotease [Lachnospiraceae bacterium]|nr:PrsW family intramembrane metalloprotease [Lachnospiraceae bacterium]